MSEARRGVAPTSKRVPHHVHVSDTLRARIEDRQILPGNHLPSENALAEAFDVSRSVIRQALATLEAEGWISKSQGRGTIVSAHVERHRDPARAAGLSAQMRALGARTATQILTHRIEEMPTQVRHLEGTHALRLERLRFVDDEPVAYIRTWLPSDLAAALPAAELVDASLHEQLVSRAGLTITSGTREVRATAARPPINTLLEVEEGFPLLLLEGESRDQNGRVIEVFSTWHRSDMIAFDVSVPAVEDLPDLAPTSDDDPDPDQGPGRRGEDLGETAGTDATRLSRLRHLVDLLTEEIDSLDPPTPNYSAAPETS